MKKGHIYKYLNGRFPFNCQYGIFVEKVKSGGLRFVWEDQELLIVGHESGEAQFEEVCFEIVPINKKNG